VVICVLASIVIFEGLKDEYENVCFRVLVGRMDREHVSWSATSGLRSVQLFLRQTLLRNFCHEQVVSLEAFLNVFLNRLLLFPGLVLFCDANHENEQSTGRRKVFLKCIIFVHSSARMRILCGFWPILPSARRALS
jgi:hypothetical protein